MRKIFSKTCSLVAVLSCMGGSAFAQTGDLGTGGTVIIPESSSSSSFNQQGFNLPTAPRATGQDIIRGSGGISCQSAIGGNGPTLDLGAIGTNDIFGRDSTALYGRVTVQLGKKAKRVDCNRLYDLEVERLRMELALLRAGSLGGAAGAGYSDPGAVQSLIAQAPTQTADDEELPESASISPFKIGGPQKAQATKSESTEAEPQRVALDISDPVPTENVGLQLGLPSASEPMETKSVTAIPAPASMPNNFGSVMAIPAPAPAPAPIPYQSVSVAPMLAPAPVAAPEPSKAARVPAPVVSPRLKPRNTTPAPYAVASAPKQSFPVQRRSKRSYAHLAENDMLPEKAVAIANIGDEISMSGKTTYFAQMGAFSSLENAQEAWALFSADVPTDLPRAYAIANPVVRSGKTLFLLQAGPYSKATTQRVCESIQSGCYPIRG